MAVVTITQSMEAGKLVIKLYSDGLAATNSVNLKFSYTASQLSLKDVSFSGTSSTSLSSTVVGSTGNAEISGQFTGVSGSQPFATLVFTGTGSGNFDLDFSSLRINGAQASFIDPPAYAFSLVNTAGSLNISLNEDSSYMDTYDPFKSGFGTKLQVLSEPKHGKILISSGFSFQTYTYVPDANYYGTDTFSIQARDGIDTQTAVVTATIKPVNDPPVGTVTVNGEKVVGGQVSATSSITDVDGMGTVQYSWQKSSDGTSWVDIAGAKSATLTLPNDLAGLAVRAVANYTDMAGTAESVVSRLYLVNASTPPKVVTGTAANDILQNSHDGEMVDGGNGLDTFVYAALRSDYTITKTANGFSVLDKLGIDASDTLNNIERIQFSDRNVALDINGTAGQAYRLYQAAFGRKPDLEGLGYWIKDMDKGSSLTTVAAGFFQSAEFQKLFGSNPSTTTLITNFYQNVLHRAPDQAGFDYWNEQISKGQITAAGALASFCESTENQAQVIGSIQNGIDYKVWVG
ncbi:DUF4214 domain-containing protein [Undibacterium sp. Tian12W]|uniref:DUF4214 domain-containing protein n=1 Tax=Undibacterium sp. Tian12W TaxID=3413054 RepID=UPI003BF2A7A1